ncbi:hypothetical protein SAMN05421774_101542 [Gemmobacter megaterium]|uniref:Uncharacterized protein n=1 Tax=Gemmobacter megaterium TaxID=1086013 RepID=A0A1N7KM58_9RHOB|nr:hypothetical protein [Gemmobacter megaterium]GGE02857.1 hypothetical protein GCM10011345_05270 [Gemmobacter megaterium]SIS62683.1 hypothetical protein SAMN05421774_101542 [Gemmobacter megaterium]
MNMIWFLRMAKWARRPPSLRQVLLVLGVVAICLALAAFEWVFGWPEALTVNSGGSPRVRISPP